MLVANALPGGAMEPREAVASGAAQDSVDGGAGDAQPPPDAVWPPGEHASCSADGRFLQLIGLAGAAQGTAGAVVERVRSTFAEPPHPLGDGRAGDAEQAGHFGLGPAIHHLFDQFGASHGGQACVTMSHEGPHLSTTSMGTTPSGLGVKSGGIDRSWYFPGRSQLLVVAPPHILDTFRLDYPLPDPSLRPVRCVRWHRG